MSSLRRAFSFPKINFKSLPKFDSHKWSSRPIPCAKSHLEVPEGVMESMHLKNNMKLICEHRTDSCFTAVGCFLPAGAIHEYPEERGAALFLEHLLFRKTRCKNPEDIENELGKMGANLSATASRDLFLFYGTVPSWEFEKLMGLLAEVILDGLVCEEDVEKEKAVILRQLDDMESNFEGRTMDYLPSVAYQGTNLGRSIYPDTCVIENMTADTVNSFRTRLFQPHNITMISTGGTSFEELQCLAGRYLEDDDPCKTSEPIYQEIYPESLAFRYTGSEMRYRDDDQELGYVAMAVEGPGQENCGDHCVMTVAKDFVGQWSLADGGYKNNAPHLAERAFGTDMCHLYKSFNIGWNCTGLWGCYFVCEKMQLEDMVFMVQKEWMRLCTSITSKEVARAVNQCKMRELMSVKTPEDRFLDIAMCIYYRGTYQTFNERLARYDEVSLDGLRQVADKYIYDQCPVISALGRIENLPDYNFIRTYMYQLRR
ncbi:mitochondrial-processing peptidase subunit beta-like [Fopius arisanus]|uniref:Mitochondrial-processing peptidase subunit beta-like n=1 Tax=Fopius arisanus TaxID=64838 RepID=A0A9R1TUH5_9HYME|nr:PREDICTED: mitochondrial-processing peptidase subunit beta-like [Fopius arisanus]